MITSHTLIETSHRLIRRANLNLEERRLLAIATLLGTLHRALLGIVPRPRPTKDVFPLRPDEGLALEVTLGQDVLVGAGETLEAVLRSWTACVHAGGDGDLRDGQDIGAGGAE